MLLCEFCKFFMNTYFTKHLRRAASEILLKYPLWGFIFSEFADAQKVFCNFDKTWTPSSFGGIFQWFWPLLREIFIKEVLSVRASSPWWMIWKSNVIFSWHSYGFFIQSASANSNLIKGTVKCVPSSEDQNYWLVHRQ